MLITVTLNPAVDKTLRIDDFKIDSVNRVDEQRVDAGGKGINVSKVLKEMKLDSIATGFLGGDTGTFIKRHLDEIEVENDFVFVKEQTRENLKIVDHKNNTFTDINDPGPLINSEKIEELKNKIDQLTQENKFIILSGSIPRGLKNNIYKELIEISKKNDAFVLLDTYGKPFKEALKSNPDFIKPNIEELEEYFNQKLNSNKEIIENVRINIVNKGIKNVAVSLGEDGALLITEDNAFYAKGMKVDVKSTVGAGDAMVAGLVYGLNNNLSFDEVLKYGSASATATVMTEGSKTGEFENILKIFEEIEIERI